MPKNKKLKDVKMKAEFFIYLLVEFCISRLSIRSSFLVGEFLGSIFYRMAPRYRAIVRRNLAIMGSTSPLYHSPSDDEIEEVFRKGGGNLVSAICSSRKSQADALACLKVRGDKKVTEALQHSGAMVVLGHMGNWELLTQFTDSSFTSAPIGALYRPLNNPYMNELVLKRRAQSGMTLISSRNPAFSIFKLLKKNGLFCVLSDQKIGDRGVVTNFGGLTTNCTRLPLTIHEKAKVPVFVMSMVSTEAGIWEMEFKRIEEPSQQSILDELSLSLKQSLPDCFWFQDRWVEQIRPEYLPTDSQSQVFQDKKRICILESKELLHNNKELAWLETNNFILLDWSAGDSPLDAYYAIGHSDTFKDACKKGGLKKSYMDIAYARKLGN